MAFFFLHLFFFKKINTELNYSELLSEKCGMQQTGIEDTKGKHD